MICCMDGFLLRVLEGRELGYYVVSFHSTLDDVGGPCVSLLVRGIITGSEIDCIQFT